MHTLSRHVSVHRFVEFYARLQRGVRWRSVWRCRRRAEDQPSCHWAFPASGAAGHCREFDWGRVSVFTFGV